MEATEVGGPARRARPGRRARRAPGARRVRVVRRGRPVEAAAAVAGRAAGVRPTRCGARVARPAAAPARGAAAPVSPVHRSTPERPSPAPRSRPSPSATRGPTATPSSKTCRTAGAPRWAAARPSSSAPTAIAPCVRLQRSFARACRPIAKAPTSSRTRPPATRAAPARRNAHLRLLPLTLTIPHTSAVRLCLPPAPFRARPPTLWRSRNRRERGHGARARRGRCDESRERRLAGGPAAVDEERRPGDHRRRG